MADPCCHGNEIWARCGVQSPAGLSDCLSVCSLLSVEMCAFDDVAEGDIKLSEIKLKRVRLIHHTDDCSWETMVDYIQGLKHKFWSWTLS